MVFERAVGMVEMDREHGIECLSGVDGVHILHLRHWQRERGGDRLHEGCRVRLATQEGCSLCVVEGELDVQAGAHE